MIRYCGRIRTSPFLCIPSFTSFSFASVCPRHSPDVFPAFSRPFLSLSAAVGVFAQGCRHLCARKFPFMRKGVGVLAQECGGPCARPPESVRRPLRPAVPSLRVRRDVCSPVLRRQRCPAVPSLRVRCRGGCALPRLSARRVAAPCGERRGIAPRRAGLSVRPVPFLRKKCGVVTGVFP